MRNASWSHALMALGVFWFTAGAGAQPLDLEAVLTRAAQNNPTLKSAYADLKIVEADIKNAKMLENPELEVRVLWPQDGRSALQEYTLSYNIIDLFNRSGRVRTAERRRDAALGQTLTQAVELEAELKLAYYTVQGHAQSLEEQKTLVAIAQLQTDLALRQREVGNIPAIELAGYKSRLLQTKTQYYDRQMMLFEARQELARLMGEAGRAEAIEILGVVADLPESDHKTAPELLAEALTQRADLAAQQYELEALQAERGQQNLLMFDGTHLGYAFERETDLETLQGLAVSMPLPVFNQRQGQKARLDAMLERQSAQQEMLSQKVTTEVKTLLVKMANARLRVEQLQQLVPLRQEMLELSRREYNAMLIGATQLLDFRGDGSIAVLTLADAKADYWRARTGLERALGRSILRDTLPYHYLNRSKDD